MGLAKTSPLRTPTTTAHNATQPPRDRHAPVAQSRGRPTEKSMSFTATTSFTAPAELPSGEAALQTPGKRASCPAPSTAAPSPSLLGAAKFTGGVASGLDKCGLSSAVGQVMVPGRMQAQSAVPGAGSPRDDRRSIKVNARAARRRARPLATAATLVEAHSIARRWRISTHDAAELVRNFELAQSPPSSRVASPRLSRAAAGGTRHHGDETGDKHPLRVPDFFTPHAPQSLAAVRPPNGGSPTPSQHATRPPPVAAPSLRLSPQPRARLLLPAIGRGSAGLATIPDGGDTAAPANPGAKSPGLPRKTSRTMAAVA